MTKRTFDQMARLAKHLGDKLKPIQEKMPYSSHLWGKSETLLAIHQALTLIAKTPNASINEAALEAIEKQIDEAIEGIRKWVKTLLEPEDKDKDLSNGDDDDEIPF